MCFLSKGNFMLNFKLLIPAQKIKIVIGWAVLFTMEARAQTTLEEQFREIENCNIRNIFLDPISHRPSGKYFSERKLEPCRIDEAAYYCVSDTFYRLPVSQIAIPYVGPFSTHAIYIKESPDIVEAELLEQFKSIRFNQNNYTSPMLISDPKQPGSSILYCDEYSE